MVDFVIWGAGQMGHRLQSILGDRAVAYIDKNLPIGSLRDNIKVISFEKYLSKLSNCVLVVSPVAADDIFQFLENYADLPILKLEEAPPEIVYRGVNPLSKIDLYGYSKESSIAIYGIGVWGLMLYDYMREAGYGHLRLIPGKVGLSREKARRLGLDVTDFVDDQTLVLCTDKKIEEATLLYPANRVEDFWNLSYHIPGQYHPELEKFRDIYKNEDRRLFIIATGPSLSMGDLDVLHKNKELTMGVNMVFRAFDRTDWRPDYYVMQDIQGMKEYEKEIRELNVQCIFLSDSGVAGWSSKQLKGNMHIFHMTAHARNGWPRISGDITRYVSTGGTIVLSCLQIAFYMGIREIYLLGADCSYSYMSKDANSHFIEDYCKPGDKQKNVPFDHGEVFIGYQAARFFAREHGIKIYNATRGGRLEVFERVDFDNLFDAN